MELQNILHKMKGQKRVQVLGGSDGGSTKIGRDPILRGSTFKR